MAAQDLDISDNKKQEELEDITTCCICTEVYNDPKALPCIHTFCLKCLQETGLKTNKGPGDEMPCPICRRLFRIPTEGFRGLPKHFFIERLIQMANVSHPSAVTKSLCSVCVEESKEGEETPTAETYCVECKHKLCDACCTEHKKFKATKNHKLISLNEHSGDQNVMTYLPTSICEVHEQKVLDVYCADCKTVVCAICFIEDHNNHKGSQVHKYLGGFRMQIQNNTEAINECISQAQVKKAELVKVKEQMQQRVESLESDVEKRRDEIKQFADKQANRFLQGLCSERQAKLKEIQMATDDIDAYLSNLESYNSYCQKLMDKGSSSDICCAVSDLPLRATDLQQQCQPIIEGGIQDFKFCFKQSDLEEFLNEDCSNMKGVIEASGASKSETSSQNAGAGALVQDSGVSRYVQGKVEDELAEAKQEILRLQNQLRLQSSSSFGQSLMDQSVMTQFIMGQSFSPPSDASDHINSLRHPDPVRSQQDYDKLKEKLMHLSITGRRLDTAMQYVNIYSCHDGDVTLFVWNSDHGHYLAYLVTHGPDHFLHADCVGLIDSLDSDLKETGKWIIAEVVSRDFCLAKKANNRFKVPMGTKLYRVKIKSWSPGQSSPKTSMVGDDWLKHRSVPAEMPSEAKVLQKL